MKRAFVPIATAAFAASACTTAGNTWLNEPSTADQANLAAGKVHLPDEHAAGAEPARFQSKVLGSEAERPEVTSERIRKQQPLVGKILGTFRNTYYDFPSEAEGTGEAVSLRDAHCGEIAQVPRSFYESVCVQGSGILKSGRPVSFARRDCECAEVCPRTGQKICFESLDPLKFPWGRGALGTPITPLLTVAVDDTLIPMGSAVYIPEYDGMPVDANRSSTHDGCFISQDRGVRVKGAHVDVFTGARATTELWNRLVPSNQGVTIVLDSPRCARADP
ncbi:MAG TPA: 3D domain-containing protein [Polyangiaceae bacterium]|jgi:3D (Asp-Asp-Asp) domain-containing protein|nr:3D domain-containing protein [Polyangiaceae bacterium]